MPEYPNPPKLKMPQNEKKTTFESVAITGLNRVLILDISKYAVNPYNWCRLFLKTSITSMFSSIAYNGVSDANVNRIHSPNKEANFAHHLNCFGHLPPHVTAWT